MCGNLFCRHLLRSGRGKASCSRQHCDDNVDVDDETTLSFFERSCFFVSGVLACLVGPALMMPVVEEGRGDGGGGCGGNSSGSPSTRVGRTRAAKGTR